MVGGSWPLSQPLASQGGAGRKHLLLSSLLPVSSLGQTHRKPGAGLPGRAGRGHLTQALESQRQVEDGSGEERGLCPALPVAAWKYCVYVLMVTQTHRSYGRCDRPFHGTDATRNGRRPQTSHSTSKFQNIFSRGAWMGQLVEHLILKC